MLSFSSMLEELGAALEARKRELRSLAESNPRRAYAELNQLGSHLGARHGGVTVQFHFPDARKISEVDSYGRENIGIVVEPGRKRFPIPREAIAGKARETLGGGVETKDAYMYEGKEGLKIFLDDGSRMDVLPGSLHLWCGIDDKVKSFVDWLMTECYGIGRRG